MTGHITAAMVARGRGLGEPRLSPDGTLLAFVATVGGRGQLVVVPSGGGPEAVVSSEPPPPGARSYGGGVFDWTPAGDALVYAASDGALWVVPVEGGPPRRVASPGPVSAPAVSPDGERVAYVVDQRHVAVASLDPRGPWPVRLSDPAVDFCLDPAWSPDGDWVVWHEWDVPAMPWDASRIARSPARGGAEPAVVAGGPGAAVGQPRFAPDGSALGFLCDAGGWLNVWVAAPDGGDARPLVADEQEHGDPTWGPGQRSWAWSPDSATVAVARKRAGFGTLDLVDVATGRMRTVGRGVHGGLSWAGGRLACERSGARTPHTIVTLSPGDGSVPVSPGDGHDLSRVVVARGPVAGFEAAGLVEPEAVEWPGADGAPVYGRLYRPSRTTLDPPSLLVWVHGGPTAQWPVQFNARIAYFLDRGWAVLVPDHRGSTGHGRAYTQALAGRWGELDVSDTAAGMRAAAQRRWADPTRMVPIGASAGGCTVLNLLAHHPELCAAGIDLYGVTDLFDLDETTHRFEAHYLHSLVGPLPDAADRYRQRSPVTVADRITAPLLILQGTADEVVPAAQSHAVAARLEALGRTVELHCYEGEGHGWARPETVIDELGRIESFLRRHVLTRLVAR